MTLMAFSGRLLPYQSRPFSQRKWISPGMFALLKLSLWPPCAPVPLSGRGWTFSPLEYPTQGVFSAMWFYWIKKKPKKLAKSNGMWLFKFATLPLKKLLKITKKLLRACISFLSLSLIQFCPVILENEMLLCTCNKSCKNLVFDILTRKLLGSYKTLIFSPVNRLCFSLLRNIS